MQIVHKNSGLNSMLKKRAEDANVQRAKKRTGWDFQG